MPLTFVDRGDYEGVAAGDLVETVGLCEMLRRGGRGEVRLRVWKGNGNGNGNGGGGDGEVREVREVRCAHSVSRDQAGFILAGSALNLLAGRKAGGV